jgi:hypothetical protein
MTLGMCPVYSDGILEVLSFRKAAPLQKLIYLEVQMSNFKGSSFYLIWTAAVTATLFAGTTAAFTSMWSIFEALEQAVGQTAATFLVGAVVGALIGAGAGLGQALALRQQGLPAAGWLVRSIIGGALGMALIMTLLFAVFDMDNNPLPEAVAGLILGFSAGLPIALAQWQLLKRHVEQAHIWIPINTAAFTIGFAAGMSLSGEDSFVPAVIVMALLTAVISGAGMVMMVRGGGTAVAAGG